MPSGLFHTGTLSQLLQVLTLQLCVCEKVAPAVWLLCSVEAPDKQRLTVKTVTSGFHVVTEPSCLLVLRVRPRALSVPVLAHGLASRHVPAGPEPITELTLCLLFTSQEERFAFLTEWYDPSAALLRRYQLLYYPKDGSVEMVSIPTPCVPTLFFFFLFFSFPGGILFHPDTPMSGYNITPAVLSMFYMIVYISPLQHWLILQWICVNVFFFFFRVNWSKQQQKIPSRFTFSNTDFLCAFMHNNRLFKGTSEIISAMPTKINKKKKRQSSQRTETDKIMTMHCGR